MDAEHPENPERGHAMAEAEVGGKLPQTKGRQEVPGAARSWKKQGRILPQHPRGTEAGDRSAALSWPLCSGGTCAQRQQRGRGRGSQCLPAGRQRRAQGELISLFVHFFSMGAFTHGLWNHFSFVFFIPQLAGWLLGPTSLLLPTVTELQRPAGSGLLSRCWHPFLGSAPKSVSRRCIWSVLCSVAAWPRGWQRHARGRSKFTDAATVSSRRRAQRPALHSLRRRSGSRPQARSSRDFSAGLRSTECEPSLPRALYWPMGSERM